MAVMPFPEPAPGSPCCCAGGRCCNGAAEVAENGSSLTKTNRGSQLMGAAVGGLALGGVGAVIGGLSGSTREKHTLRKVGVQLTVDDPVAPLHYVETLPYWAPAEAGSPAAATARNSAQDLYARIITAMRQAERAREGAAALAAPAEEPAAGTGEIERLWRLREAGALTDDEFQQQKARVLTGGDATATG